MLHWSWSLDRRDTGDADGAGLTFYLSLLAAMGKFCTNHSNLVVFIQELLLVKGFLVLKLANFLVLNISVLRKVVTF